MLTRDELPECPVATTVQLIGNKWKIFVIQRLLDRPWRFNELARSIPGISEKVLSQNLKALEADGIIVRTVYAEVPPRVEYSLSPVGESLRPLIMSLADWGESYKAGLDS
jgi:DNA-binding HxlR family transcriptional regulator